MTSRRAFAVGLSAAMLARPLGVSAQQKAMPVVGVLGAGAPGTSAPYLAAFRQGLSETGYVEGQNVAIEYRWAEGRYDRWPAFAADLVGHKVDLIVAAAGADAALAAKSATSTIPIVFIGAGDPIRDGLVTSLAHPGGNLTGFSNLGGETVRKRLEVLAELIPQAKVIAALVNPRNSNAERITGDLQEVARAKGVQLPILKAGTEGEIDAAFAVDQYGKTPAAMMLIDRAVAAYQDFIRISGWTGNTALMVEHEFFGRDRPCFEFRDRRGQEGPKIQGLTVEQHLARLREGLIPLAERCGRVMREALAALEGLRAGPSPAVERSRPVRISVMFDPVHSVAEPAPRSQLKAEPAPEGVAGAAAL